MQGIGSHSVSMLVVNVQGVGSHSVSMLVVNVQGWVRIV